ncbi:MAG: alpha/beta hydrolase [Nakamurella sp.]
MTGALAACSSSGGASSGSSNPTSSNSTIATDSKGSSGSSSSAPQQNPATGSATAGASYETIPCPTPNIEGFDSLNFPPAVTCGYLTVPENRAKPDGRQIRVFVARAPAVSATPKEPLVWLAGGPGGAGSFNIASMVAKGVNADRDVYFVDQRGTHHADPLLSCPEVDQFENDTIDLPLAAESTTTLDTAAYQACRDRLVASGVDLASYNSTENAADLADLRVALGISNWSVYGVSYGTRLALTLLRDHPEGIKSLVLDSVSPPVNNIADTWWSAPASSFKAIFAACAAQPTCAAAYPNLAADFTDTVNRLDATPLVVQTQDSSGAPITVNIDG